MDASESLTLLPVEPSFTNDGVVFDDSLAALKLNQVAATSEQCFSSADKAPPESPQIEEKWATKDESLFNSNLYAVECLQATHAFKHGEDVGFKMSVNGMVLEVNSGGQADKNGVKVGDRILKVGDEAYSPDALESVLEGRSDYTVTFQVGLEERLRLTIEKQIERTLARHQEELLAKLAYMLNHAKEIRHRSRRSADAHAERLSEAFMNKTHTNRSSRSRPKSLASAESAAKRLERRSGCTRSPQSSKTLRHQNETATPADPGDGVVPDGKLFPSVVGASENDEKMLLDKKEAVPRHLDEGPSTPLADSLGEVFVENIEFEDDDETLSDTTQFGQPQLSRSARLTHNLEHVPSCGFVINVRRLIQLNEFLGLLHDLLKSTAIAALTLVAAGTPSQCLCTVAFVTSVFILYAMHEQHWDKLDVEDVKTLLKLISDDVDPMFEGKNPNRLLKAITRITSKVKISIRMLCHVILSALLVAAWLICNRYWTTTGLESIDDDDDVKKWYKSPITVWTNNLIGDVEDAMAFGMQVMVGSLMLILHFVFEYTLWRETNLVLPMTADGDTWDPRRHGTPLSYRIFGMPSMWFTSQEAIDRVIWYIDMATSDGSVMGIFPTELASLVLSGDEEREELQLTLAHAKLFDATTQKCVLDNDGDTQPLGIDLCFFDSKHKRKDFPYAGDFLYYASDGPSARRTRMVSAHTREVRASTFEIS